MPGAACPAVQAEEAGAASAERLACGLSEGRPGSRQHLAGPQGGRPHGPLTEGVLDSSSHSLICFDSLAILEMTCFWRQCVG